LRIASGESAVLINHVMTLFYSSG